MSICEDHRLLQTTKTSYNFTIKEVASRLDTNSCKLMSQLPLKEINGRLFIQRGKFRNMFY